MKKNYGLFVGFIVIVIAIITVGIFYVFGNVGSKEYTFNKDSGIALSALKVDGGAAANNYLMQSQSDICGAPVLRPKCVETTAMGAAYLAGLAVGYWADMDEIRQNWAIERTFTPEITADDRTKRVKGWKKAVRCTMDWAKD